MKESKKCTKWCELFDSNRNRNRKRIRGFGPIIVMWLSDFFFFLPFFLSSFSIIFCYSKMITFNLVRFHFYYSIFFVSFPLLKPRRGKQRKNAYRSEFSQKPTTSTSTSKCTIKIVIEISYFKLNTHKFEGFRNLRFFFFLPMQSMISNL